MSAQESADAAVASGIAWLDAHFGPDGWKDRIDLEILNMVSGDDCVCGQLERSLHGISGGDYAGFMARYDLYGLHERGALGFTQLLGAHLISDLDQAWRAALTPAEA